MNNRQHGFSMRFWAMGCLLLNSMAGAQQVCDTSLFPLSSPTERFEDHGDGTVTDTATMLMWMRCSLGQTWSDGGCVGDAASLTWVSAKEEADRVNEGGQFFFNDWRIPNLRELATIAERECENPRINLEVFPNTPAGFYWSTSSRSGTEEEAYALSFGAAGVERMAAGAENHVRLVRTAP